MTNHTSKKLSIQEKFRSEIEARVRTYASNTQRIVDADGNPVPWLFDFRAILLEPHWLDAYAELFWERFEDKLPFQVCAMESAGISLVSAIVMKSVTRGTPVNGLYVRKSRKKQGLMKVLEGTPTEDPVIMVDDLVNSGRTFEKQLKVLEGHGLRVADIYVLVAFREQSSYAFALERGIAIKHEFGLETFGLSTRADTSEPPSTPSLQEVWRFRAQDPSQHLVLEKSAPIIDDERVYFGTDEGTFLALEQQTGAVAWSLETGAHPIGKGILSSPTLARGTVFFGAYDGNVYALDAKTGEKRWTYEDADWVGSSPDIAPDLGLLYIGLEFGLFGKRGGVIALRLEDGAPMWEHRTSEFTHGSPLYIKEEGLVIIGSNDGTLYAHDATTGDIRWQYAARGEIKTRPAYDAVRRFIVFGSMDCSVYILNVRNGLPVHAKTTGAGIFSIPLIHDGVVYVASLDKSLYAIDLDTFDERWHFTTRGRIFASPTLAEGSLWIGSNDGCLYELDPKTGAPRSYFQTTERIVNAIAYNEHTKRLFVPTATNELYCFERKRPAT